MRKIRKSVIAGSWYPGNPSVLRDDIGLYLQRVPDRQIPGEVIGLIVPHAGYMYSGQVAAYAYKLVHDNKYDVVILIGPSHRVAFRGVSVYSQGGYETPLGVVPVDELLAAEMMNATDIIVDYPPAHQREHSLEIQLPFLQVVLGEFSFIPLVMGEQSRAVCRKLASAIHQVSRDRRVLLVASTDLSHFYEDKRARLIDAVVLDSIRKNDADGLMKSLDEEKAEACGGGPMVAMMLAANLLGAGHSELLQYANSGDITGDKSSVVGYASAVIYRV